MRASTCSGPSTSLRLREVVDDRVAVVRAVAAAGDPADQVVAVGGRERQDLDELDAPSRRAASSARSSAPWAAPPARAVGHARFGRDASTGPRGCRTPRDRSCDTGRRPRPAPAAAARDSGRAAQTGGIADASLNRLGKIAAIRGDDRILGVEDVERRRAVVGVDDHLDAVADVVDRARARAGSAARVRIAVRGREGVHHPRQPAVVADARCRDRRRRSRNGASAVTRSRTLRRISSRLSAVTSSLNGSLRGRRGRARSAGGGRSRRARCRRCLRRTSGCWSRPAGS